MASFNKTILVGNLTRQPEMRQTAGNQELCEFGMAMNESWMAKDGTKKEETVFVDITVWGNQAGPCNNFLDKGSLVLVEGRLKLDTWVSKEGENRNKLKVVAQRVQFLTPKQQSEENHDQTPKTNAEDEDQSGKEMRNMIEDAVEEKLPF
jgi:single-strand DNA-binding protein